MPGISSAEQQLCNKFVKQNSKKLSALVEREVKKGRTDPLLANEIAMFYCGVGVVGILQKVSKDFVKQNNKVLVALANREVAKGATDPALASSVTSFLAANKKPWYWPF